MIIPSNSRLLMIGDSITDCDRARPIGDESRENGLGHGYVVLSAALLGATYPGLGIRFLNTGVSGDTVRDLKARWPHDVLALRPDWLSIMIGINDVWRWFDPYFWPAGRISEEEYEETLDALIRKTLPGLKGLILMTPYVIEPDRADPMRERMDRFGRLVERLAARHGALFVDTQAAYDAALQGIPAAALAADRVHPNLTGHMILARAFLQGIGYRW